MSNPTAKSLYNALINKGYTSANIGDEATFISAMEDKTNRKELFDMVVNDGYDLGDYNTFEGRFTPQPTQPIEVEQPMAQVPEPMKSDTIQPVQPIQSPKAKLVDNPDDYFPTLEQNTRNDVAQMTEEVDEALNEAKGASARKYAEQTTEAAKGGFWKAIQNAMVNTAGAVSPTDMQVQTQQQVWRGGQDRELAKDIDNLEAAEHALENAQRTINEADINAKNGTLVEKAKSTFVGGAARGFGQKLFDVRTWDMGATDLKDQMVLNQALDAAENGTLTESQQALLDAKAQEMATQAYFGSYVGRGYKAGSVTAESLPFMLEMCINPASTLGESAASRLARYAIGKYGKRAAKSVGQKAVRIAGRALGDVAGAATMTATTGSLRTAADAMDRMSGGVAFDTDELGHAVFDGRYETPEDVGTAIKKAFAATTIENYSEMLGSYFAPMLGVVGKGTRYVLDKITAGRVGQFLDDVAASDFAKAVSAFEKNARWSGNLGEFAEEIAGGTLNAIVVGDQTLDSNPETGVFNRDNLTDTFLGVTLLGGSLSMLKTVGYGVEKYQQKRAVKRADVAAADAFGSIDEWDKIKTEVDAASNKELPVLLGNILSDPDVTDDQKTALMVYVGAKQREKGAVIGEQKRRENPDTPQEQVEIEQSFDNGAALETPQEKNDAQNMFEYQQQQMRSYFGLGEDGDVDAFLGDDPIAGLRRIAGADQQAGQVILDYLNAKATVDGVFQRMSDDVEAKVAESDAIIQSRTNNDNGMIQRVTLKNGNEAYVVSGDIVMTDDGKMVNTAKSSESIIVRDAITGKLDFSTPSNITSAYQPMNANVERETLREQVMNEYSQRLADEMNGTLAFAPGDNYTLVDEQGAQHNVQIVADNGDGTVAVVEVMPDGVQQEAVMAKSTIQEMSDTHNQLRLGQYLQDKQAQEAAFAEQEKQGERSNVVAEQQPVSALSQIPQDKKGKHDFNQVSPDLAWRAIVEMNGGDIAEAVDTAKQMQKKYDDALKAAQKEKPKVGIDVESIVANKKAHKEKIDGLQAIADHWAKIVALGEQPVNEIEQAEEVVAENVVAEEAAPVAEQTEVTPEVAPIAEEVVEPVTEQPLVDHQGNPIDANGQLIVDIVESVDELSDDDFNNPTRSIQLPKLPKAVDDAIGADGKPIIIKKNIFERNLIRHSDVTPEEGRLILNAALYNPNIYGQNQKERKPYNWVVVSVGGENGSNKLVLLEVNKDRERVEVVHWHFINQHGLEKLKRQAEREDGQLLILPSETSEEVGALSDPTLNQPSESKDTTTEPITQEVEQENLQPTPENVAEEQMESSQLENEVVEPTSRGTVDMDTLQLTMSDEEFNSLLESGDVERMNGYLKELDDTLVINDQSPFKGQQELREEFKRLKDQYGGEDNIPTDVMEDINARYTPYAELSRKVYDRKYALEDKLRTLDVQQQQAEKEQKKEMSAEHKATAFNGFLANKTALGASNAVKALSKKVKIEDKNYTIAEYVEQAVQSGKIELRTSELPKYKGVSRRKWNQMDTAQQQAEQERIKNGGTTTEYYINDYNLGKVAYDYAQYLQAKATEQTPETASESQTQSAVEPEWLQKVPTDGRNFMVYTKVAGENSYSATDLKTGQAVGLVYASLVKRDRLQSLVEELPKVLLEGTHFQIRDTKGKIYYSSEPIETTKGKKKATTKMTTLKTVSGAEVKVPINLYKYVSTDKTRVYTGVYFDPEGFVVATDGHNMIAVKHDVAEADAEKFISKAGDVASTVFKWRIANPKPNTEKPMDVDFVDVEKQIGGKAGDKFVVFEIDGQEVGFPPKAIHVLADFQRAFGGQAFVGDMTAGKAIVIRSGDNYAIALQTTKYADLSQAIHIPSGIEQTTEHVEQPATMSEQAQQSTEPVKQEPKPKRTADRKIEDFGEKIAGARKDILRNIAKAFDNATLESLIALPFAKAFAKPDLKKLVEEGVLRPDDAKYAEAIMWVYINKNKPKPRKTDKWKAARGRENRITEWAKKTFDGINRLREFIEADEATRDALIAQYGQLSEQIKAEEDANHAKIRQYNGDDVVIGNLYSPNPIEVIVAALDKLNYQAGDKIVFDAPIVKAEYLGRYFIFENQDGERIYAFTRVDSIEEAIDRLVLQAKIRGGDTDIQYPSDMFAITREDPIREPSGVYTVYYFDKRGSIQSKTVDSKEEAEKKVAEYKSNGSDAQYREETKIVGYSTHRIRFKNRLTDVETIFEEKFSSEADARQALEERYDEFNDLANDYVASLSKQKREQPVPFEVSTSWNSELKTVKYIVKNTETGDVMSPHFDTRKQAEEYYKNHIEDWKAKWQEMKDARKKFVFFDDNVKPREGKDYRNGRDVTAEEFTTTFGFRGTQFGNWTNDADRQAALNQAYDAFMDLADILGVSPKALSLAGELGIAFGARGGGSALAHYEPDEIVINLTKTKGAGSLAHEWWHALDNYFSRQGNIPMGFVTTNPAEAKMREEMRAAWQGVVNAVKGTEYAKRSMAAGDYWGRMLEMTARLFAEWTVYELAKTGRTNHFLSRGITPSTFDMMRRINYEAYKWSLPEDQVPMPFEEFAQLPRSLKGMPFPTKEETEKMGEAVRNLFDVVQEKVDEQGNVVLFQMGDMPEMPTTEASRQAFNLIREKLRKKGIKVHEVSEEMAQQMAAAVGGSELQLVQRALSSLDKTSKTIARWLKNNVRDKSFEITLPEATKRKVRKAMGRDFDSHNITANGIVHALKNHGEGGKKLNEKSIPIRKEDVELIPYIMVAPDFVEKGSTKNNRESVRYYKNLSNGYVVVIEKELDNSVDDLETINMWAELSDVSNAQRTLNRTSETPTIGRSDAAKIRKDAEIAIQNDVKLPDFQIVYHGSGAKFDRFDHSFMGTGEGAQAYGWGTYVTQVEGIGKSYAKTSLKKQELESNLSRALERLPYTSGDARMETENLIAETRKELEEIGSGRNLYTVEIPESNGEYLQWDSRINGEIQERVAQGLQGIGFGVEPGMNHLALSKGEKIAVLNINAKGKDLYAELEEVLGGDKAASNFLSDNGFVGIEYPAQYRSGGRADNAKNYVIFNENDLKIIDRVELFQDSQGKIYGWAVGGEIYLTPDGLNANTAIHEYSHLWAEAMRKKGGKKWDNIKSQLKDTPFWNEVINDPNYEYIRNDEDRVASEVLARLAGKNGAARLTEEAQRIIDAGNGSLSARIEATALVQRVKRLLRDLWAWVSRNIFGVTNEATISQFSDMVVDDLLDEVALDEEAIKDGDVQFNIEGNATLGERSDADSSNSSSEGLLSRSSERLRNGAYGNVIDGAKIKEIEESTKRLTQKINKFLNGEWNLNEVETENDAVRELGNNLGMRKSRSSNSYYGDFYEGNYLVDGNILHLRISTHPASAERMGNADADHKVSIVIRKNGEHYSRGVHNGYEEIIYEPSKISPQEAANAVINGVKSLIENGEYVDITGKADKTVYSPAPFRITPAMDKAYMDAVERGDMVMTQGKPLADMVAEEYGYARAYTAEEQQITAEAQRNGTYLKAPNGKPTNLTPKQWVQVRTKAFKRWFGDWILPTMETPIHKSKGTFANLGEAEQWAKKNLQGQERENKYTGEKISIGRKSVSEMLNEKALKQSHSINAHLAALRSVLDFIETGIPAEVHPDTHGRDFDVMRLYNAIDIDNKVYRVKSTVRKVKQGDKYYTYEIQEMELIEERGANPNREGETPHNGNTSNNSITAAKLLKGVKKTNSSEDILSHSQILDANGEPMVVWHGGTFAINEFTPKWAMHFGTKEAALQRILDQNWGYGNWEIIRNDDDTFGWKYTDPDAGEYEDEDYSRQSDKSFATPIEALEDATESMFDYVAHPYYLNIRNVERVDDMQDDDGWDNAIDEAKRSGVDGLVYRNDFEDEGNDSYIAFRSEQVKSADPVTYDDNGNVIPLSERFNSRESDIRFRSDVDEVFDADFAELESEYQQLDKNDEQAMAEWRAKKKRVVEGYLNYMTDEYALPCSVFVFDHNDEQLLQQAFEVYINTLASKSLFWKTLRKFARQWAYDNFKSNFVGTSTRGVRIKGHKASIYDIGNGVDLNKKEDWLNTLLHENTHYVVEMLGISDVDNSKLWEEFAHNGKPATVARSVRNYNTTERRVSELLAYSVGDFIKPERVELFDSFMNGDATVEDILKFYNESLPLRNDYVRTILNKLKNGRKVREEINRTSRQRRSQSGRGIVADRISQERDSQKSRFGRISNERDGRSRRDLTTISEAAEELAKQLNIPIHIIGDVSEITDDDLNIRRRKRNYKGWYDVSTGEVVVVAPNATSVADIQRTVIHEVVAHNGLRELFGADFDTFLDNVYRNVDEPIRRAIANLAARKGWDFRVATEEYLASLAETTNFEEIEKQGWWQKIRDYFMDLLRKVGVKLAKPLTNDELRYILWRSYQMQKSKGAMAVAEDVDMQRKLGVGNFRTQQGDLRNANEQFNRELQEYIENGAKPNTLFHIGMPQGVMRDFLPNLPIVMLPRVLKKASRTKHNVELSALRNLPSMIAEPIFVFNREDGKLGVLTEIKDRDGKNVCVAIELNKTIQDGGTYLEVNDIVTIHGRDVANIILPIAHNNTLRYVDKKKGLDWLSSASYNYQQEIDSKDLDSATKIVEEFDNAKYRVSKNVPDDIRAREGSDMIADDIDYDAGSMTFEESITNGLIKLAQERKDNAELKMNAIRAIGGNLSKLRKAMTAQRKYDQAMVDSIIRIAKMAMNSGFFTDMSRAEVSRLLTLVNKAASSRDITNQARDVVDMLIKHQVKEAKTVFEKLLKVRGAKVDSRGIIVQGKLDNDGQRMIATFKEAIKLSDEALQERIDQTLDEMGSDDNTVASNATIEYQGLLLAQQYLNDIRQSEIEEADIRKELREVTEKELLTGDDYKEFVESVDDAIRENRLERIEAYSKMIAAIGEGMSYSIARAKEWREQQKQRVQEIHHNANSDLQGVPTDEHSKLSWKQKLANNGILRFVTQSLGTFEQYLRYFGGKSANGEGYLYNRFIPAFLEASDKEWKNKKAAQDELSAKLSDIMGKKMSIMDVFSMMRKMPTVSVQFWDTSSNSKREDKDKKTYELTQGNLLYIYMVNKMSDGRMKLRNMGISEQDVAEITKVIDPRFIKFADWLQDEFLVKKRNEYNEVHKRMFGASMAAIENYFPLVINSRSRNAVEKVEEQQTDDKRPSTITGGIIKRVRNSTALDLTNADAFAVVLDHVDQMERWAAFAEFNRDINALLSYKRFRNKVLNMSSARFGAGNELWKNFKDTCAIAAGVYRPKGNNTTDAFVLNIAKGATASKITFRLWTAIKQLLSLPAFLTETSVKEFAKACNPAGAADAWNWALEELPTFAKRWQSRQAGDSRLRKTDVDWKLSQTKIMGTAVRVGMTPNAFIDALSCVIGAKAIYETKYKRYLKQGYSEAKAKEKALIDASNAFNTTQQSSEGAYLSTIQEDRTVASVALTVFRNSNMAYARKVANALANLKRRLKKGYREESIAHTQKQMMRDGLSEAQALSAATRLYNRQFYKDCANVLLFGFGMNMIWELGSNLSYLIMGDDDEEKEKVVEDALMRSIAGPIEGLVGGDIVKEAIGWKLSGKSFYGYSFGSIPMMEDIQNILSKFDSDKIAAINDVVNILIAAGTGVNLQTLTDTAVAILDATEADPTTSKEAALLIMRIMQIPQSQIDEIYIDELGISAREARDVNPEALAHRYAEYKRKKATPITGVFYSDEEKEKAEKKYVKRFEKLRKERVEMLGDPVAREIIEDYEDDELNDTKSMLADLKKLRKQDATEYFRRISEFDESPEYQRYQTYKEKQDEIDDAIKAYDWRRVEQLRTALADELSKSYALQTNEDASK